MALITLNNRAINRSDTASADDVWTATSATATDFQAVASSDNTPAFLAYQGSDQTSLASGSTTKIEYGTEIFDTDSTYDHSTNYRWTPAVVGKCCFNKSFDIPHPTRKGKRLRHVCVEGPESAIYIRGQLKDESIIELPDYWKGLVDPETITVTLSPFGRPQSLYIDSIPYGRKIIIKSEDGTQPNCHYNVWVSRWLNSDNHDDKLHVVYDGESPADYPGDNNMFSFSLPPGYHGE